jgi:uncharacterized protein
MTDFNQAKNRAVWFDIPVADLVQAKTFYEGVLNIHISIENYEGISFGVLEHKDGNGGCLMISPDEIASDKGILLYLNVEGRLQDAVAKVTSLGGAVIKPIHAIGPHGFRAIVRDSEGNRVALHSTTDA